MVNLKKSLVIVIIFVLLLNFMCLQIPYINNKKNSSIPIFIKVDNLERQQNWHNGTNILTPEVNLKYWLDTNVKQGEDILYQNMFFTYNDLTFTRVGFQITISFDEGGLDLSSKTVLNWSKAKSSSISMISDSFQPGYVRTEFSFDGFDIINGTAKELQLEKNDDGTIWDYSIKNIIGTIQFKNTNYFIGPVNLYVRNYLYNNQVLKESIAEFNVTINSTIGTETERCYIPVILKFQITHNITSTIFKYGMDIDWSTCKAFPTEVTLNSGDNFTLISRDLITVSNGVWQIGHFTTDSENKTALFIENGVELGREYFTTNYQIKGDPTIYNTTRIYIENESSPGEVYAEPYVSKVFVCFDGFKYNQSSGFVFDPIIVIPCSANLSIFYFSLIIIITIVVISVVSVIYILKKRSKPKIDS
ncbi:MAG: hypothetical protein ACTSPY_00165 [Candidatus Helarchaeota archaeon]